MKLSSVYAALALSSMASAVTFRLHPNDGNCANGYMQCSNNPANTCCHTNPTNTGFRSARIFSNPPIQAYFWKPAGSNQGCGQTLDPASPGKRIDSSSFCVTYFGTPGGVSTGATWRGVSKKRGEEVTCTGSVRADEAVLRDGHKFDTGASTPDADAQSIFKLVQDNATIDQVPASLKKYEVHDGGIEARAAEIASF